MKCEYCQKDFSTTSNLRMHQRRARYCLELRGDAPTHTFDCGCGKTYTAKDALQHHQHRCVYHQVEIKTQEYQDKVRSLQQDLTKSQQRVRYLEERLDALALEAISAYKDEVHANVDRKERISYLEKKYLKKQPRTAFPHQNVIYILTTPRLQQDRTYILGKATNLTNRLSTYNKTDEHEVVHYEPCGDKEKMDLVENLVFSKLAPYREQANRERFILPEEETISTFIDTVKGCVSFLCL